MSRRVRLYTSFMTVDEFVETCVKEYGAPYTKDAFCIAAWKTRCQMAATLYHEWGYEPDGLYRHYSPIFKAVQSANMYMLMDAGFSAPAAQEELISPVLDFRDSECMADSAVGMYHAKLDDLSWKLPGIGCADQSGHDIIIKLPEFYDIWLQLVLSWDNPATLLKEQFPLLEEAVKNWA